MYHCFSLLFYRRSFAAGSIELQRGRVNRRIRQKIGRFTGRDGPFRMGATRFVTAVILLVFLTELASAQVSNLARIELSVASAAGKVLADENCPENPCLSVAETANNWLVRSGFETAADGAGRVVPVCSAPYDNEILATLTDIRLRYVGISNDRYRREAEVSLAVSRPWGGPSGRSTVEIVEVLADTIDADGSDLLASSELPFTQPVVTDFEGGSFWSDIAEPVVVVSATVGMILLLFVARGE